MSNLKNNHLFLIAVFVMSLCYTHQSLAKTQCGKASWYSIGKKTASGERFLPMRLTAAHRSLRFGTFVFVKNMRNGRTIRVKINDRGPFIRSRIIDVSLGAAKKLAFVKRGVTRVCITY